LGNWKGNHKKKSITKKSKPADEIDEMIMTKEGPALKIEIGGVVMYKIDGDDTTITEAEAREREVSHSFIGKSK